MFLVTNKNMGLCLYILNRKLDLISASQSCKEKHTPLQLLELTSFIPCWDPQPEGWHTTPYLSTPQVPTIQYTCSTFKSQITLSNF